MKIGDLVKVKDVLGYSAYMQNFVGHIGVVCELTPHGNVCWVRFGHLLGKRKPVKSSDLEVIA